MTTYRPATCANTCTIKYINNAMYNYNWFTCICTYVYSPAVIISLSLGVINDDLTIDLCNLVYSYTYRYIDYK